MARPSKFPRWATNANFPAGANPWNGQPSRVDPGSGKSAEGFDPTEKPPAQILNWLLGLTDEWLEYLDGLFSTGFFGDKQDGDATDPAPLGRVAMYGTLTLNAPLSPTFPIYCDTLILNAGAVVHYDGVAGANGAAGVGGAGGNPGAAVIGVHTGTPGKGGNGGNTGADGTAGGNDGASFGGNGGHGKNSSNGAGNGAVGGTTTAPTGRLETLYGLSTGLLFLQTDGAINTQVPPGVGGGGGGGGGDSGVFGGGGGGGAGGVGFIAARSIVINGNAGPHVTAKGGKGGDGVVGAHEGGGGGGGGGGTVIVLYQDITGGPLVTDVTGGAQGLHGGAGGTASAVGTAKVIQIPFGRDTGPTLGGAPGHIESGFVAISAGAGEGHEFSTINFQQAFPVATGAAGYDVECSLYNSANGQTIDWTITTKATDHVVITFSQDFDGELRWKAYK